MPFHAPRTLSADDVYALTAYVLNLNNIVPNDFVADRNSLPKVKMPNRDHFIWQDPRPDTAAEAVHEELQGSRRREDHLVGGRQGPHAADDRSARRNAAEIAGAKRSQLEKPMRYRTADSSRR